MNIKKYNEKHINFLKRNVRGCTYAQLAVKFNRRFGLSLSEAAVAWLVFDRKLLKGKPKLNTHKYTPKEIKFLEKNVKGRSTAELTELFNRHFGLKLTVMQIRGATHNRKLWNGRDTKIKKGNIPPNKGKKGFYAPGSEKGWFKKGHKPVNWRPEGSERINADGYVEIKVSNTAMPVQKRWRCKHVVIWEKAFGKVPKGYNVIFLDGNRLNIALDNLMLIHRQVHAVMCHMKLFSKNKDVTKANAEIAAIKVSIGNRKRDSFKSIKSKKMVFVDNNGYRVMVGRVKGQARWVPVRETKLGLRKMRVEMPARNSYEAAQQDLYEYAQKRGWQRI